MEAGAARAVRGVGRIAIAMVSVVVGAFCVGVIFSDSPCRRDNSNEGVLLVIAALLFGVAAALGVSAIQRRPWMAWATALVAPIVFGFGIWFLGAFEWVGACAN
jgi:hypothetical protein